MSDFKMALLLTEMGYDVELDLDRETFNTLIVCEMAINEGYRWNGQDEVWK